MRDTRRAKRALELAESAHDEIERSLWLASAADHGLSGRAVLVGGAAVNLHTGSYVPADVDMCAYLDEADRASLRGLGFGQIQGDHFEYTFADGEHWLLEFPDSVVDGTVTTVDLGEDMTLEVISLESLIVDRLIQTTDGFQVTFNEAVRLATATFTNARWDRVAQDVAAREARGDLSGLSDALRRVHDRARKLLDESQQG